MRKIRNAFIAGIIVSIPLGFTIFFLRFIFNFLEGMLRTPTRLLAGRDIPGLGMTASVVLIFLLGVLANNILGKRIIAVGEHIIERTPLAGSVYTTVKQIVDTFVRSEKTPFQQVCLIEWPRRDMHCIAFVTGDTPACVCPQPRTAQPSGDCPSADDLVNVFIPTTPNPTSGFLVFLPRKDVVILDITVEEGLKMVVSGGILSPEVRYVGGAAR
ncbi:MAG: DUF502 domain-containing protein [Ignavibacteriales bacterium]